MSQTSNFHAAVGSQRPNLLSSYTRPCALQRGIMVLGLACAALCTPVLAEKADKTKPLNAEADALRYDDLKQTSVFTGNVAITKGTITIRATRVEVRQDPEGYQFGLALGGAGKRAFFRQKREGVDEWIEGEADTIDYDGKADTVKFNQNAVLRRYRGSTLADETTGSQIVYDNITDVFSVVGGVASPANPGGRIRAVLTPQEKTSPASSKPVAPLPANLRQSKTLSGEIK